MHIAGSVMRKILLVIVLASIGSLAGATPPLTPSCLPLTLDKNWALALSDCMVDTPPPTARQIQLKDDMFDLSPDSAVKEKTCAVFFNRFDAPRDGIMQIGMAADWWFECFVNGKKVYDTMRSGNLSDRVTPADHIFNLPVRGGGNLLAVKVYSGSKGWKFAAGPVPYTADPTTGTMVKIIPSEEYKPVRIEPTQIKGGTALDFSNLLGSRQVAGANGRVIVNPAGRLAFENAPDRPVRFFSFNFIIRNHLERVDQWTHADIERFARAVANQGYNMVRIHQPEQFLLGWKIHAKPFSTIKEAGIPQRMEDIPLDQGNVDRLDYLIACFKKLGVYVNLDIMGGGPGCTMARVYSSDDIFKAEIFFNPIYRNHWKVVAEFLLDRMNPYTKTKLKDDPALACVDCMNEQDLLLSDKTLMAKFTPSFRDCLRRKYGTDAALAKAWGKSVSFDAVPDIDEAMLRSGDTAAADAGDFLVAAMSEMTDHYAKTLRGIGYPGLINHWDMIIRTMEIPVRAKLPAIAQHIYFAHPGEVPKEKKGNGDHPLFCGSRDKDSICAQGSSLDSNFFRAAAAARFLDRPYLITEYSHSAYNQYRHERGLFFGSYAALQGWDMLTAHADTVRLHPNPVGWFESAADPISRAAETVAALVWLRGDVKEAPHSVALQLTSKNLFPKNYLAAIGDDYAKIAMLTKFGILYPEVKPLSSVGVFNPTLEIIPENYSPLKVTTWWVSADTSEGGKTAELIGLLRKNGILPSGNKTDFAKKLYQSETGELTLNAASKVMTVISPRLEGVILKQNQPVTLDKLALDSCSVPASVVAASLENDKPLNEAKHLLLIVSTNALNKDMVFDNASLYRCLDFGYLPVLMRTVKAELRLKTTNTILPKVYSLYLDGTRAENIPCELKNNELDIKLDTTKLQYATPYFEIIF